VTLLSGVARRAVFAPLDDGAARSEAVVRRLGGAIALGLIVDGEQLPPEVELATSLNVSTMTLRDALGDLRARGLVTTRRGRAGGSFVRVSADALADLTHVRLMDLGTTDLREMGDFHAAIAGVAARLAASRASQQDIGRLREITEQLAVAGEETDQRRLDGRFHIEVAACAQSVRFTMQEIDLQVEAGQLPWPPSGSPEGLAETVRVHRAVVDAIAARDGDEARRLVESLIGLRSRWMIDLRLRLAAQGERPTGEVAP
jgi:DNA-binding FadR family transcriptional regulator